MKKMLLAGAATLLPGTAAAGPALYALVDLFPADTVEVAFNEERMMDGAEIYEGLRLTSAGDKMIADRVAMRISGGHVLLSAVGYEVYEGDVMAARVGDLQMMIPRTLGDLSGDIFQMSDNGITAVRESACDLLGESLNVTARDVMMSHGVTMHAFQVLADIKRPDTSCILDLEQSAVKIVADLGEDLSVTFGSQNARSSFPLTGSLPDAPMDVYTSSFEVRDGQISLEGTPQVTFDTIEAKTFIDLAETEPQAFLSQVATGNLTSENAERFSPANVWNALHEIRGRADFYLESVKVVRENLSAVIPTADLLERGDYMSAYINLEKTAEQIGFKAFLDSSFIGFFDTSADILMRPVDLAMNGASLETLLMTAPVEVARARVAVSDRGASEIFAQMTDENLYETTNRMLERNLGEVKAALIGEWLEGARDGGTARAEIAPAEPMSVMTLFGDPTEGWSGLSGPLGLATE